MPNRDGLYCARTFVLQHLHVGLDNIVSHRAERRKGDRSAPRTGIVAMRARLPNASRPRGRDVPLFRPLHPRSWMPAHLYRSGWVLDTVVPMARSTSLANTPR